MQIFVASTNPVKINAVITAASETWPEVKVQGVAVKSGVSDQPMTDEETQQGSVNRAKNALAAGLKLVANSAPTTNSTPTTKAVILGVGLEGGVFEKTPGELWSTVWVTVVDPADHLFSANGARFRVPNIIAQPILAGEEMGPVVGKLFNDVDIKKKHGAIGVVTKNFIDRTEEYTGICKLVLGLWYGRDWEQELVKGSNQLLEEK